MPQCLQTSLQAQTTKNSEVHGETDFGDLKSSKERYEDFHDAYFDYHMGLDERDRQNINKNKPASVEALFKSNCVFVHPHQIGTVMIYPSKAQTHAKLKVNSIKFYQKF